MTTPCPTCGQPDDVAEYAHALQVALTGLTRRGSEFFVRHGDGYRADIPACLADIYRRRGSDHWRVVDATLARKAAEKQLAEITCGQGWNPDMEAAPRDGTKVLLWGLAHNEPVIGSYWVDGDLGEREPCWMFALSRALPRTSSCEPTHWMPLPIPPETDEGEAT